MMLTSTRSSRTSRAIAMLGAVGVLLLASCGNDAPDAAPAEGLRPPVAIQLTGGTGPGGAPTAEMTAAGDDVEIDPLEPGSRIGWFGGFDYVIGDGFPGLPTQSTAYQYAPGADVDAAVVTRLADALGVEGEPERGGSEAYDVRWRVGPDDGTAPSLTIVGDGQLGWYYSSAWMLDASGAGTTGSEGTVDGISDGDVGTSDDEVVVIDRAELPEPPANLLSADQAIARAREVLAAVGKDPAGMVFETYVDEWFASVTAAEQLGDVVSPVTWGFGFGAEGVLEWASGSLATPTPTGPYPLVDLDAALIRLDEQWSGSLGRMAVPEPALVDPTAEMAVDDAAVELTVDDAAVELTVDDAADTAEAEVAVLVDVRADLWWAWDDDGSVWLLPAYTFIDTEGRTHTVPAVTDEYLIMPEPGVIEPGVIEPGVIEPSPGDDGEIDEPIDVEDPSELAIDVERLIGLTVADAEAEVQAAGGSLRVLRLDGEELAGTMDLVPTRVNVAAVDDLITEIISFG